MWVHVSSYVDIPCVWVLLDSVCEGGSVVGMDVCGYMCPLMMVSHVCRYCWTVCEGGSVVGVDVCGYMCPFMLISHVCRYCWTVRV